MKATVMVCQDVNTAAIESVFVFPGHIREAEAQDRAVAKLAQEYIDVTQPTDIEPGASAIIDMVKANHIFTLMYTVID